MFRQIRPCSTYLKEYDQSVDCFRQANEIQRHDTTFMQMGKVFTLQENYKQAIEVYLEALEFSPENPEVLTTIGLLYLRLGENYRAFDFLGNSLTHDPKNAKTILAAGSIIQDHSDMDVALIKYRVAAVRTPNSAQLWNNIGMCFFGKQRYIASIACLKRALYLDPFEWIISYNLGLVHLNTGQCASAFHFFSSSINLKPDFPSSYMYLAITLVGLGAEVVGRGDQALIGVKVYFPHTQPPIPGFWVEICHWPGAFQFCLFFFECLRG